MDCGSEWCLQFYCNFFCLFREHCAVFPVWPHVTIASLQAQFELNSYDLPMFWLIWYQHMTWFNKTLSTLDNLCYKTLPIIYWHSCFHHSVLFVSTCNVKYLNLWTDAPISKIAKDVPLKCINLTLLSSLIYHMMFQALSLPILRDYAKGRMVEMWKK